MNILLTIFLTVLTIAGFGVIVITMGIKKMIDEERAGTQGFVEDQREIPTPKEFIENLPIMVKYHDEEIPKIKAANQGEWYDLAIAENVVLKQGEHTLASFGVTIALPPGYEAIVAARSSTFKRYGVLQTNAIGVIDASFRGEKDIWKWSIYATRDTEIPKGTRVAQFRLQGTNPPKKIMETDQMFFESRGGFGSTGK